jgi:glycosyltransferase involved in cell wall biosynthesis
VGTLSRVKGADLLAEILPNILSKYENTHVVFIGRDDGLPTGEKLFGVIKKKCREYINRLNYFSPLQKQTLYPIIQNSLGVLIPSRVDNYPNVCLEALMLGVPVVGTYNSSLDEMIIDGKTGFLANNNNTTSLMKAIERLLKQNTAQKVRMKNNIKNLIEDIKSEDRIGQLESLYEETIFQFINPIDLEPNN